MPLARDTRVSLMPKPFAVLRYLVEHAGRLVTQDELLSAIWPDTFVQPEVLRRYILEIRRALDDEAGAPIRRDLPEARIPIRRPRDRRPAPRNRRVPRVTRGAAQARGPGVGIGRCSIAI